MKHYIFSPKKVQAFSVIRYGISFDIMFTKQTTRRNAHDSFLNGLSQDVI